MNSRFIVGQFGRFDINKYNREFIDGFYGIEACQFEDIGDIERFDDFSVEEGFEFGVHFPLRKGRWLYRDPQYLAKDKLRAKDSYEYMKDEFRYISSTNAKYILLHYPKPVILDADVDWDGKWRFADESEYYFEDEYSFESFSEQSDILFSWIDKFSEEYKIPVYIELDAVNEYLYDTDLLVSLLDKYSNVNLCLDFGRLHLQDMIDDRFNAIDFMKKVGAYVRHVHLWNVKVSNNVEGGHFPALPTLKHEDGWADFESYFMTLNKYSNDYTVLFEHDTRNISDEELLECYSWVNMLISVGVEDYIA